MSTPDQPNPIGQISPDGNYRWDGNQWQGVHPPSGGVAPPPPPETKKKRRVFLWFFLAVNVLFLVWVIGGIASGSGDATDCGSLSQQACNDAQDIGTGIGIFLIIVFWFFVDAFLGIVYGVYRLATRR